MDASTSSPIKLLRPNHAAHIRNEIETFVIPEYEEELTVAQFWEELDYNPNDFRQHHLKDHWRPKEDFEKYMNDISERIFKGFTGLSRDRLVHFHNTSATPPLDHPTGTMCKPDFVACPATNERIHWTEIDSTVEIHSAGTNARAGPRQAASYTLYLLQARPDRVSVQGFYVDEKGVMLIISSSDGVKKSPKLNLKDTGDSRLIYAFVKRLYDPLPSMIDPTVKRWKDPTRTKDSTTGLWVFDIRLTIPNSPSVECVGYRIENVRGSVGQRTHIFVNNEHPTILDGVPIPVIKDQYRHHDHRFSEAEILRHIHTEEEIPGVVRIGHSEAVVRGDGTPVSSGDRHKTRIGILEYGKPFMDLQTPLEALVVIYDLLESTRLMYFERRVLHRDISAGNVLHMKKDCHVTSPPPTDSTGIDITSRQPKFCSVNHLLDPTVEPNATMNLLIDLDRGEIFDVKQDERRLERTGTPIYMARAVRAGGPFGKVGKHAVYESVPDLSQMAHAAYEKVFPDRLIRFQHSPVDHIVKITEEKKPPSWRHELRHDAESAFWLLLWWVVNATPADGTTTEIPNELWASLVGTRMDLRPWAIPATVLDPLYAPLSELLDQLGEALDSDLHWATDTPYTHPDFLHEVFQRRILNFIFDNQDKEFMNLRKADFSRKPEKNTTIPSLSTPQIDSLRTHSSASKRSSDSEPQSGTLKKAKVHHQ